MNLKYLSVQQPIGIFYLASIEASILKRITVVERRSENPDAVQREESAKRIKEISEYCSDVDATFPTPIIVAVDLKADVSIDQEHIIFDENSVIGEVIDGQHRLGGLKLSDKIQDFQLPVVFMFDLLPSQKAYIFSIINSKQTRVNMSLIYDLFSLSEKRSPYKTCHEIARLFNKESSSPYYKRMKMLGKKSDDQLNASITQGSFIKYLLKLITKDPDRDTRDIKNNTSLGVDNSLPLRLYFIDEKDSVIYKILFNYIKSVSNVFSDEWNDPDNYLLSKSVGFGALVKLFPVLYGVGSERKDLSLDFFKGMFEVSHAWFTEKEMVINSESYGTNEQSITKLYSHFRTSMEL